MFVRILVVAILAQPACSLLFDEAPPYSLKAVWQRPTDTSIGQVAVGEVEGTVAFAGNVFIPAEIAGESFIPDGPSDIVIARIDPDDGTLLVPTQFGAVGMEFMTSLSVAPDGAMVVGGGVLGDGVNLGGDTFEAGADLPTGFAARYSSVLDHQWSLFYNSDVQNSTVSSVSAGTGAIYACGYYAGQLSLPQSAGGPNEFPGLSQLTAYYAKYNPIGTFAGGRLLISGQGHERCETVLSDGGGAAYIAGSYSETIDFSGDDLEPLMGSLPSANPGKTNLFIAKVEHDGSLQWVTILPGGDAERPVMKGARGSSNELVLVSEIEGVVELTGLGGSLVAEPANLEDVALFILSPSGTLIRGMSFPGTGSDRASGIAVGPDGEIAIVGRFSTAIDFGGSPHFTNGLDDAFIAVFDKSGNYLWSETFGSPGADSAQSVAFDAAGALYISVRHQAGIDFGLGELTGVNAGVVVKFERGT